MDPLQEHMERVAGPKPITYLTSKETSKIQNKINKFMKKVKDGKEPLAHIMELDMSIQERKWAVWWLRRMQGYIEYWKSQGKM